MAAGPAQVFEDWHGGLQLSNMFYGNQRCGVAVLDDPAALATIEACLPIPDDCGSPATPDQGASARSNHQGGTSWEELPSHSSSRLQWPVR